MRSDDQAKDVLLGKVWNQMKEKGMTDPMLIRAVVSRKDYYDISVPIRDYDADFIEGCLIDAWDQVSALAAAAQEETPF